MLENRGCAYGIMIACPHSLTAVPAGVLSEGGGSLGFSEFQALKAINKFGQYRALAVAGVGFIAERAGMISGADTKTMLLAIGLLATDALITSVYTLRAGHRHYKL